MKNSTKVDIGISIFGLSYGSLIVYEGIKHNNGTIMYLGSLCIYFVIFFNAVMFLGKHEKKIKEWLNK